MTLDDVLQAAKEAGLTATVNGPFIQFVNGTRCAEIEVREDGDLLVALYSAHPDTRDPEAYPIRHSDRSSLAYFLNALLPFHLGLISPMRQVRVVQ